MPVRERALGIGLAFAAAAISGVSVFVNGYGTKHFADATVYTTAKNLVAAALLGAIALGAARARRRAPAPRRQFTAGDRARLVTVGIVGGAVPFVLFFEGLRRASSTDAAFLQKTLVVWVAVLAVPVLHERLRVAHFAAIGLLLLGQARLASGWPALHVGAASTLVLAATLCWAVEVVVAKPLLGRHAPITVATSRMGIGVVTLLGWVAVSGRMSVLVDLDAGAWGWALLTGVLLCAYVATWFSALALAPAVDVTAVLVAGALVTAFLDAAVHGAALRPELPGLVLVAAGVVCAAWAARIARPPATAVATP